MIFKINDMKKLLFLVLIFTLFSCKENTYEELEAEVLCDVLPEVAKYELNNSYSRRVPPPPPNYGLDSLEFTFNQMDSITDSINKEWLKLSIKNKKETEKTILKFSKLFATILQGGHHGA